jgi:hypothetical protein
LISLLSHGIFAAPGRSRTLISHERLSILKGKENLSIEPLEKELSPIDVPETVDESKRIGEKLTCYFSSIWYHLQNTLDIISLWD